MSLSPRQRQRLHRFFAKADVAQMTLHDAGRHLRQIAPLYQPRDACHRISSPDGMRWYAEPLDALIDTVWRATHRPHDPQVLLVQALGSPAVNGAGLVGLQPRPRASMQMHGKH